MASESLHADAAATKDAEGAPRMREKITVSGPGEPRAWAIVLRGGDEVMSGLLDFAKRMGIRGGHFSGIGAFSGAMLAFFDRETRSYKDIPISDQVECLSLNGDIGLVDGEPVLHVHCTLGYPDGTVRGGHVLKAVVWPTLEVFLTESTEPLLKEKDPDSTLDLYNF